MEKFNNFNDIKHIPLRTYNRAVTIANIKADLGDSAVLEYVKQFNEKERRQIALVMAYMAKYGQKKTQEECTKGLEFSDDEAIA